MTSNLYRELVRILIEAECEFVRQGKGSHEIWYSSITRRKFTIPAIRLSCIRPIKFSRTLVCRRHSESMYLRLRQRDIPFEEIVIAALIGLLHMRRMQADIAALEVPRLRPV